MVEDYFTLLIVWLQVLGLETYTTIPHLCSAGDQTQEFVHATLATSTSFPDVLTLLTESHHLIIRPH